MENIKKKWFWGIFISLLVFFAMSHNASAAMNLNYEYYDLNRSLNSFNVSCGLKGQQHTPGALACSWVNTGTEFKLNAIYQTTPMELKAGDIIQFYLYIGNPQNYNISGGIPTLQQTYGKDGLLTLDVEVVDDWHSLEFYTSDNLLQYENAYTLYDFWANDQFGKVYKVIQRAPRDGSYRAGFDVNTDSSAVYLFSWYQNANYTVNLKIFNLIVYRPAESRENKEVEEKTQDAVDQSEAAGGSSSQDAQTGTTGLLNAITGAVNVISSASPTNCKINGNMGNLDIGQLDLCANPAPTFIQTIGSLILILMCVPLAISLFNRFIAIFRSFQS